MAWAFRRGGEGGRERKERERERYRERGWHVGDRGLSLTRGSRWTNFPCKIINDKRKIFVYSSSIFYKLYKYIECILILKNVQNNEDFDE